MLLSKSTLQGCQCGWCSGYPRLGVGNSLSGKNLGYCFCRKVGWHGHSQVFCTRVSHEHKGPSGADCSQHRSPERGKTSLNMLLHALFYHFQVTVSTLDASKGGLTSFCWEALIIEEDSVINSFSKLQNFVGGLILLKIPWHGLMFQAALIWITLL